LRLFVDLVQAHLEHLPLLRSVCLRLHLDQVPRVNQRLEGVHPLLEVRNAPPEVGHDAVVVRLHLGHLELELGHPPLDHHLVHMVLAVFREVIHV
jgi:hypothetical protein